MNHTRFLVVCMLFLATILVLAAGLANAAQTVAPPDAAHREAADALLQQIWAAQPGQPKFDAINAVVAKYKQSDEETQNAVVWLCLTYTKDANRGVLDRWPCIYVLAYAGYTAAVPDMIEVLSGDPVEAMRAVAAEALGGIYKLNADKTIYDALLQAAKSDTSKWVYDTIAKYLGKNMPPWTGGGQTPPGPMPNPPDDAHQKAADAILKQIWDAAPGQPKFTAIDAVVAKYKQSDAVTKSAIAWLCLWYTGDTSRGVLDRWPCMYVLTRVGYMPAIPSIIDVLLHNDEEAMRAVAAESLGMLYKQNGNKMIYDALVKASQTETSKWVQETLARYVNQRTTR